MNTRKWLHKPKSYLKEIELETVKSKYSKSLTVSMIRGRYQLFTNNVIYSYEDLYKNFKKTADRINWKLFRPKEVLVLGLGLGSVIQIFEKKCKEKMHFTAVDLDEACFYLTQKYTAPKFKSSVEYVHADAESFILQNKRKYDLILFDVFIEDKIPVQFQSLTFLKKLQQRLHSNGLLLMNRLAQEPHQVMDTMKYIDEVFNHVFPRGDFVHVSPNYILVSDLKLLL